MLSILQLVTWAQDTTTTTSTTRISTKITDGGGGDNWYTEPWVWILGAALFTLLLVALLRGNSSGRRTDTASTTDKVTVTKTESRNTDTDVS